MKELSAREEAVAPGRAVLISIPKCGKNVVHCFLGALGLKQFDIDQDNAAVRYTHARHLERLYLTGASVPTGATRAAIVKEIALLEPRFQQFLEVLPSMPAGTWVQGHFAFHEGLYRVLCEERISIVFLHRDPRDCVLSMADFLVERGEPADFLPKLREHSQDAALRLFLEGRDDQLRFDQIFDSYRGWLEAEHVLKLRFSDIIGPRGGGRESAQITWLAALAEFIGWRGSSFLLTSAILSSFNPQAGTFYRGQTGRWKASFSPAMIDLFEETAGHLLRAWGYEEVSLGMDPAVGAGDVIEGLLRRMLQEHQEVTARFIRVARRSQERLRLLRAGEEETERLRNALAEREGESQARLRLFRALEGETERLRAALVERESESQARLKLFRARDEETKRLRAALAEREGESQRRLRLLRAREAEIERLRSPDSGEDNAPVARQKHLKDLKEER